MVYHAVRQFMLNARMTASDANANRNIMYITVSSRYLMRWPCDYALEPASLRAPAHSTDTVLSRRILVPSGTVDRAAVSNF